MKITKIVSKFRDVAFLAPMALVGMHSANAGPVDGLLNYIQQNVGPIGTVATIGVGLFMLAKRADMIHIVVVCAGIWIITNASTVASMISGG